MRLVMFFVDAESSFPAACNAAKRLLSWIQPQ
jgi:hypothetical protein